MNETMASINSNVSHSGAASIVCMEIYNHQVPALNSPTPNQKPSAAAWRSVAACQRHISRAGQSIASGQ